MALAASVGLVATVAGPAASLAGPAASLAGPAPTSAGPVAGAGPGGTSGDDAERALAAGHDRAAIQIAERPAPARRAPRWTCTVGLAYQHLGALTQAEVFLTRCAGSESSRPAIQKALSDVRGALARKGCAPVSFVVDPAGARLYVAPLNDREPLPATVDLWLCRGAHRYRASAAGVRDLTGVVEVKDSGRQLVPITLGRFRARAGRGTTVDLSDDGQPLDAPIIATDPRPKKHKTLIPDRFLGKVPPAGPPISDRPAGPRRHPAARRPPQRPRAGWAWPWPGLRRW